MDVGEYYSESVNKFGENPEIAIPALVGNVSVQVLGFLLGLLTFFILGGFNYFTDYSNSTYTGYPDMGSIIIIGVIIIVCMIIVALIYSFMYAGTIGMAKKVVRGQKPKFKVGIDKGKKYFLKVFLIGIIQTILYIISSIPLGIGFYLASIYSTYALVSIIVGILISLILYALILILFIFTYQAVVVSGESVIGSFKSSYKLVKNNFIEVIIVLVINGLILAVIATILFLMNLFLGIIPIIGMIFAVIISIVVNSITFPFFNMILTYLYMDLKDEIPLE